MSTKKSLLAIVVTFVLSNVLTTVYYMVTDEANMISYRRDEMNYLALMANHLIYAALMVYFFPTYYVKNPVKSRAFVFGVLIAALMFIPQALVVRAIWTVDINTIFFVNTFAHLFIGGIMGTSIALIYGNGQASDS